MGEKNFQQYLPAGINLLNPQDSVIQIMIGQDLFNFYSFIIGNIGKLYSPFFF
jgi:hypothetical protein